MNFDDDSLIGGQRASALRATAALDRLRLPLIVLTIAAIVVQAAPWVPRQVIDFSRIPLLGWIHQQQELYGGDTVADQYEARVVVTDVRDMYTKRKTDQTELEAHYWTRVASAPYPPVLLLVEAALYTVAGRTLAGFYLAILAVAAVFLGLSLVYCLRTRWYLFPLLYLNFQYLGSRFAGAQDCSYLVMLTVIMGALFAARRRRPAAHVLMAIATTMKLSPLFYATEVFRMRRRTAIVYVAVCVAGLIAPYFVWPHYLDIYVYGAGLKGSHSNHVWAFAAAPVFAAAVWYVQTRHGFDMEDRIGWSLVPMATFFAVYTNTARHLVLVLLIPDKRVWRNLPVPLALTLRTLFPEVVRIGSVVTISLALLGLILAAYAWAPIDEDHAADAATPDPA